METNNKYSRADIWLLLCVSAYFIMNGAQLWETSLMVPAWTAAPPASLTFFQDPYRLDFKEFWIALHSVHEVIFIVAIIFNWKIKRRRIPMVLILGGHIAVRVWTLTYFAPTIIEFQQIPYSNTVDSILVEKAANWRNLNYFRVGLFFILNLLLLPLFKHKSTENS